MWGSLFNKLDPNRAEGGGGDGTLQSAVRSASEDLRSKAAELQGKLLARLKGGGRGDPSGDRDRGSRQAPEGRGGRPPPCLPRRSGRLEAFRRG